MPEEKDYVYVARKRGCGCAEAVVVDDHKRSDETSAAIQEMMKDGGCYIERMPGDDFRAMAGRGEFLSCTHGVPA